MERVTDIEFDGSTTAEVKNVIVECPYDDVTDVYTVTVSWTSSGETVEFESLRHTIALYEHTEISQEELAQGIKNELPFDGSVEVSGKQYGMYIRVKV